MTTPKRRQVKLLESFKKAAKDDVQRDTAAGKCVAMSEPDLAARQWELAEQHRAWLEALEHENLITYRKHAGTVVVGKDEAEREMSLDSKSDWSGEGDKFCRVIAQQLSDDHHFKFPSWVTADLANIVFNHGRHSMPDVSQNALRTLMLILEKQPPVSVRAGPVEIEGANNGRPSPLTLLTPPAELEPWVGLPGGRAVGSEQTAAQAFGKSLRSSAKRPTTKNAKPAKYGVHWLVEEVPKWLDLLEYQATVTEETYKPNPDEKESDEKKADGEKTNAEKALDKAKAQAAIENAWGSVWLVQYLLKAWQLDLNARVQVVESHASSPAQQKHSQQMLTVSYVHRAVEDVASSQAQALLDKCWTMAATMSPSSVALKLYNPEAEELAQAMLEAVRLFLRLIFKLLGAAEDIGLAVTSTAFCQCTMKRQTLDSWLMRVFQYSRSPREWHGMLLTLVPRDRMRFLSMFLSHRFHLMNFNGRDVAKYGAGVFEHPGELYASDGTDAPATFVDISPGTTMHVLTTGDMLSRFYKAHTAFSLDCNSICVFVHHLCESALQVLPELVRENRFRVKTGRTRGSNAGEVVLEPLQDLPKCYGGTHRRFEKAHILTASQQKAACEAEILNMQRGVTRVVTFLKKLVKKGELKEAMQVEDCQADGKLITEMLRSAQDAGIITWESAALLKSAQRRLQTAVM